MTVYTENLYTTTFTGGTDLGYENNKANELKSIENHLRELRIENLGEDKLNAFGISSPAHLTGRSMTKLAIYDGE